METPSFILQDSFFFRALICLDITLSAAFIIVHEIAVIHFNVWLTLLHRRSVNRAKGYGIGGINRQRR